VDLLTFVFSSRTFEMEESLKVNPIAYCSVPSVSRVILKNEKRRG